MKLRTSFFPAALLLLTLSGAALAAAPAPAPSDNAEVGRAMTFTPEQRAQYDKLFDAYWSKMGPLHDQLEGKFLELRAIDGLSGTTKADVSALVQEITDLKAKMREEHRAFARDMEKAGLPYRHGPHAGMGGFGNCAGGCADMGFGPGGCPGYGADAGPGYGRGGMGCGGGMGGHGRMGGHGQRHGGYR